MKNKRNRKRLIIGIVIGYLAVMLMGYLGISFYYSSHFVDGAKINGIDCSNMTADEVKEKISESINDYSLKIMERDGSSETIMGPQIKLTYVDDNRVDELLAEQDNYRWPSIFSKSNSYEMAASTTYDEELLEQVLDNMSCFQTENIIAPENAYITTSEDGFVIEPEVMGTTLDRDKVKEEVLAAIKEGKSEIDLDALGCYEDPEILSTSSELTKSLDELNQMVAAKITFTFDTRAELVDSTLIMEWIIQGDDGAYMLDTEQVAEYVRQLAELYDTFGSERTFTTHDGEEITLTGEGDYGWSINKTATTDALIQGITDGVVESREPVYQYTAMSREENDIGDTYVEISLSDQRLWCYKDGELVVSTSIISGDSTKGYATPSGSVWAIDAKKEDAILEGESYTSPVSYWMPFEDDIGIHDADKWRQTYGGEVYKGDGTKGSIEISDSAAEKVFNAVEVGTPVIIYD